MKNLKGFITGAVLMFLLMTMANTVFAGQVNRTITALYRDIKITIDGQQINPKDASGNTVEPFIVDGTTYLPVRAIAEAVGYDVSWDDDTSTVILDKKFIEDIRYEAENNIIELVSLINEESRATNEFKRNERATISFIGEPDTIYTAMVRYQSGWSTAAGLGTQVSDEYGKISWTWHIGGRTTFGEWPFVVMRGAHEEYRGQFEVYRINFFVIESD